MTDIVYIAGSISDGDTLPTEERVKRIAQFKDAAVRLSLFEYQPIDPTRDEGREDCVTWLDYMRASLRDIANCDGIALLPGWEKSAGAVVEHDLGRALGLPVRPLAYWLGARA